MNITVIGTIFVDIKGYPKGTFIPDGRNPGYMLHVHGGVGRNIAEDLARIGLPASFVSLTDESGLAQEVTKRLQKSGVNTEFCVPAASGMGTWMAIFNDKGDVAANISIRPDLSPMRDLIDRNHREIFENTDGIILEIDIDEETMEKVFYYAQKYDKKVYVCVSVMGVALERKRFFPMAECLICNRQEAGMLFDTDTHSLAPAQLEQLLADRISEIGCAKLIVTMDEKGAVYADAEGNHGFCPAESVTLVDSTGAGDGFCAGASAAMILGKGMDAACRVGNRLAARVIESTENVCPVSDFSDLQ